MKCQNMHFLIRQYAMVVFVNLGMATTGMSLTWSSPMLVLLRNADETPLKRPITEEEGSWIVAGGYLMALFTNTAGGMLLDLIGRKYCVLLVSLPKILMSFLLIFGTDVWMIIFGRIVMIAADSYLFLITPVYASEIASKEHRGILGTFSQIFSTLGVLLTLSIGPFLSYTVFNVILSGAIITSSVPILFLPESPFYLYSKGRTEEAYEVLKGLRVNEEVVKLELEEYKECDTKKEKIKKNNLLSDKFFLKSLCLGMLVCVGSQITGFNAVQFYLQTILEFTHTDVRPEIGSVVIGAVQLTAACSTTFFIRFLGRRSILMLSLAGMFLGMIGLGIFFKISESEDYEMTGFINYLPLISLIFVIFSFCSGIGSIVMLVTTELFDGPARAFGVSLSAATSIVFLFLITKYFVLVTSVLGPANIYWIFSGLCVSFGTLIGIFMPETKGRSFREIQKDMGRVDRIYSNAGSNGTLRRTSSSVWRIFKWSHDHFCCILDNETFCPRDVSPRSFSGLCVIVGTLIGILMPETKGRLLKEIQKDMGSVSNSRNVIRSTRF